MLHSTIEPNIIHEIFEELQFWENIKNYLIEIIPIVNITENREKSNSINTMIITYVNQTWILLMNKHVHYQLHS